MKPAEAEIGNVCRLAVLDFTGPPELARLARDTFVARLREGGGYTLAEPSELARFAPAPLYDEDGQVNTVAAVEAAARMRLDGILVGRLLRREESMFGNSGSSLRIGDPTTTVALAIRLIDARTGKALFDDRAAESYTGELTDDRVGPTSEEKVMRRLVAASAAKAAAKITPHEVSVDVKLATATFGAGAAALRAGNRLARAGAWQPAMEQWQSALAENPQSHAAMYNLGLAYESVRDFQRAGQMYASAAEIADKELYREAMDRAERNDRQFRLAVAQIQQRRTPPAQPRQQFASLPAGGPRRDVYRTPPRQERASHDDWTQQAELQRPPHVTAGFSPDDPQPTYRAPRRLPASSYENGTGSDSWSRQGDEG
jgi:hypothetical protein